VVLEQVGRRPCRMIDGVVRAHQGQCGLVVEVAPRALHLQLGFLLEPARADTLCAPPPGDALLQSRVVEHATAPHDCFKLALLLGSRLQLVLEGLAHGSRCRHAVPAPRGVVLTPTQFHPPRTVAAGARGHTAVPAHPAETPRRLSGAMAASHCSCQDYSFQASTSSRAPLTPASKRGACGRHSVSEEKGDGAGRQRGHAGLLATWGRRPWHRTTALGCPGSDCACWEGDRG